MAGKLYVINPTFWNIFAFFQDPSCNTPTKLFQQGAAAPFPPTSVPVDRSANPAPGQFGNASPIKLQDQLGAWSAEYHFVIPASDPGNHGISIDEDLIMYVFWDPDAKVPKLNMYDTNGFLLAQAEGTSIHHVK